MIAAPTHLSWEYTEADDPRRFAESQSAPAFDRAGFQARVDEAAGVTHAGRPVSRLVWGPEVVDNEYGKRSLRYGALYTDDGQEAAAPRWILEERFEPEQYHRAWQASRHLYDPRDEVWLDRGDPPAEWYGAPWVCAEHDPDCCRKAKANDRTCWGYYREPDERDLTALRYARQQALKDKFIHPFEPMTVEELESLKKVTDYETGERRQESLDDLSLRLTDFWNTHSHRVLHGYSPKRNAHGKYTFMGGWKETESGIVLPN